MLVDLLRRHHRVVEDVDAAGWPRRTTQTSFSSGVRPMPWLGQPCRLTGPFLNPSHLDAVQLLAGLQVADLEAEQLVDVHEARASARR